jgi:hypothetical protein
VQSHYQFAQRVVAETSKTGKKTIVLNAPALAILNGLPRASSFPGITIVNSFLRVTSGPKRASSDLAPETTRLPRQ